MPRSGSSALAGVLHHLGINMGPSDQGNQWNEKGHFEDAEWYGLNNAAIGYSWTHPIEPDSTYRGAYCKLIAAREGNWGVKDARLCFTWPVWSPVIDSAMVITIRRPIEASAISLAKRWSEETNNEMTYSEALRIQEAYQAAQNRMRSSLTWPWLDISFHSLLHDPSGTINTVGRFLDIPVTPAAIDFVESRLVHQPV